MPTRAKFVCDCGNRIFRPPFMDGHPECLRCENMVWVEDVERNYE